MGSIHVVTPGLLTTVQDLGRWGFQSLGVPVAGAMDGVSHRLANLLVGNDMAAATLEVTLTGPELRFSEAWTVAVAGAAFDLTVDGAPVATAPFVVPANGVLRFGARASGARAYVAAAGGIDVTKVLGSRSTYLLARMGGHAGRSLRAGDQLLLGQPAPGRAAAVHPPSRRDADASSPGVRRVRVLAGPQDNLFARDALQVLQSERYMILPASDRMGFRLSGPAIRHGERAEIISDATAPGSLQVPPSGQPILLMADRQTSGGYAKLATVITADLPTVAQAAPGEFLAFVECTQAQALAALIAQERRLLAFGGA
jgi:antagonist of KipI